MYVFPFQCAYRDSMSRHLGAAVRIGSAVHAGVESFRLQQMLKGVILGDSVLQEPMSTPTHGSIATVIALRVLQENTWP